VYLAQQGFDMNMSDENGDTGFHLACFNGNLNVVQFLLQKGFDMNIGRNDGATGFHLACFNGNLNVVQFLLQEGFDMYVVNNDGYTGFHLACFWGKLNVVRFILQKEFDMNVVDFAERTGFHWACLGGRFNVVQFLLQEGFEGVNELNFNGKTGLQILISQRRNFPNNELYMQCILLLIEHVAQLDETDLFLCEGLSSAIQNRIFEITLMEKTLFEKWTGRIAQAITDFTIDHFTSTSLQNLSQFLD